MENVDFPCAHLRPQVWVITGDKQETAINIAIACKLIRNPDSLLICNASSREEADARLQELLKDLHAKYEPIGGHKGPSADKGAHSPFLSLTPA
jgi:magnesium-transporting ATPase (P-type)